MSQVKAMRRAVATIRHDEAADAIPHIGHKKVHHFWPLLSPCFRDVLVAPHHRADEDAVMWTWREPGDMAPPSAVELVELRRRLEGAMERFARGVAAGQVGRGSDHSAPGVATDVGQLEAVMQTIVKELTGRPDADLSRYVCRTENGLRVHCWGAGTPARPTHPETRGLEISGRVLVAGKPARHDVVLESSDGETIAEVPSDEAGEFSFSKLSPGEYRLRARSVRGTFPPHGLVVDLHHRSVKGLVLADARADPVSPLVSARRATGRRSRRSLPLLLLVVISIAGGVWGWRRGQPPAQPVAVSGATRATTISSGDMTSPTGLTAVASDRGPDGFSLASSSGTQSAGSPSSAPSTPAAVTPGRHTIVAGDREPDPGVFLPASAAGSPGGAGTPPSVGGARAGAAFGTGVVSTTDVHGSGPRAAPPAIESDRGAPAGRPPVPAVASAMPSTGANPRTAPAASPPASGSISGGDSGAVAAAAVPGAAAHAGTSREDTPPVTAGAPVEATDASPTSNVVAEEAAVATPRTENAREAAGTDAALANAADARRDGEGLPPALLPVAPLEAAPAPLPLISAAPAAGGPTPGPARPVSEPLTRTVRVRVSPWRARLLADSILPTAPTPLARSEPVALLRARLLAEREARMPQALREPRGRWGLALDLGTTGTEEALTWQDGDGGRPDAARVTGGRAEVAWTSSPEGGERQFRLSRRDGTFVAEVNVADNGREFTVRTMEETRAWLLLAVGTGPESRLTPDSSADAKSFVWRSGAGDSLPSGWIAREGAFGRGEAIAEVPLGSLPGAAALQAGALFDPESGWAIVADIRQAADRPLGN